MPNINACVMYVRELDTESFLSEKKKIYRSKLPKLAFHTHEMLDMFSGYIALIVVAYVRICKR